MSINFIPFNKPWFVPDNEQYLLDVLKSGRLSGNNSYFEKVADHLKQKHLLSDPFLVPSGTSALEMGAWLAGLKPCDEVILPSYTFSSTANAVVLTGAKPVFCEIDPVTMNADPAHMEELINEKTRMLLPIDYAGIPCEIDRIESIAKKFNLCVMVDAAQSYGSYYQGKACGSFGDLSTFSFHETKNISCGEGGALIINREDWVERAHFLQEKGTDRRLVLYGQKTKYHWVDIGSSFLLSDILAALLYSQLESEDLILSMRKQVTDAYRELYKPYVDMGLISITPYEKYDMVNSHAFWVIFDTEKNKEEFILRLKDKNVYAYIGYMPLHSSPMGIKLGNRAEDLPITQDLASRLVRLPLYADLANEGLSYCLESMHIVMKSIYGE
ncbi:MAG: dTDP-4-amino-4,6-dideoxygalactose transaminase [Candidatus Cloacimonas sp.]|jgi:dTDP-4-amino-4,6-dideoxygalactose transaminase|nr:dTDP-4-amino-4,6-dideoxygalactose transaminase [Candidatus Cloacimonas sp.]